MTRMVTAMSGACFGTWRAKAFEMKGGKRKMTGFSNRMINSKISGAFETWQAVAADGKDADSAVDRLFSHGARVSASLEQRHIRAPRTVSGIASAIAVTSFLNS